MLLLLPIHHRQSQVKSSSSDLLPLAFAPEFLKVALAINHSEQPACLDIGTVEDRAEVLLKLCSVDMFHVLKVLRQFEVVVSR